MENIMGLIEKIDIQKLIKTERELRGLSYQDIADALGCSASYIFRLEKGNRKKPSYDIFVKLLNFFELTELNINKYIEGYKEKTESDLKSDIISFISQMDADSFQEITKLISLVKEYQSL